MPQTYTIPDNKETTKRSIIFSVTSFRLSDNVGEIFLRLKELPFWQDLELFNHRILYDANL
jgi:hypothetical protein